MKDKLLEDKKEGVKMHFSVYVYYGHCSTYRVTRQYLDMLHIQISEFHKSLVKFCCQYNDNHFPIKTIFAAKFFVFLDGALENLDFVRFDGFQKIND